jgi:hypothetical protein
MATTADANLSEIYFKAQSAFDTAATGNYETLRYTGDGFFNDTATTESEELRSTRDLADIIRTDVNVGGDLGIEYSYGAHDLLMEYGLMADASWTAASEVVSASILVAVETSDHYELSAGSWANTPSAGDWVYVRGFTTAANNGFHKVVSADTNTITVEAALTNEVEGDSIDIDILGDITNGVALTYLTFEKEWSDLDTVVYDLALNCNVQSMGFDARTGQIITGDVSIMGDTLDSTTSKTRGGEVAAATNAVMNVIDHVKRAYVGGVATNLTGFSWSFNNGLYALPEMGTLGTIGTGKGTFTASGTIEAYLRDTTLISKYLDYTETALALTVRDGGDKGYVFEFPSVRFTDGEQLAGGRNSPVLVRLSWQAHRNATYGYTARFGRWAG